MKIFNQKKKQKIKRGKEGVRLRVIRKNQKDLIKQIVQKIAYLHVEIVIDPIEAKVKEKTEGQVILL